MMDYYSALKQAYPATPLLVCNSQIESSSSSRYSCIHIYSQKVEATQWMNGYTKYDLYL
jgi:hypothetical protein